MYSSQVLWRASAIELLKTRGLFPRHPAAAEQKSGSVMYGSWRVPCYTETSDRVQERIHKTQ